MLKRKLLIGVGLVVVGGLSGLFWSWFTAVPCPAARVRIGEIAEYVDLEAKTRVERTYKITMPIAGRVEAVAFTPGTRVSQGQVVAQLLQQDLENHLTELSATVDRLTASIREAEFIGVEQAEVDQSLKMVDMMRQIEAARKSQVAVRSAELAFAGTHLERIHKAKEAYAVEEVESAESQRTAKQAEYQRDYHDHLASLEAIDVTAYRAERFRKEIERKLLFASSLKSARTEAEARLAQARLDFERCKMHCPIDGVVLERFVNDERVLPAGAELLELARLSDMEIVADLLTQDASRIPDNARVEIYGPTIGSQSVRGTVRRVEPTARTKISSLGVEEQRVNVIIAFERSEVDRLLASHAIGVGYRVRVRILISERSQAKLVPRFAIHRGARSQWETYVVRAGVAVPVTVQVGLLNEDSAEILGGLQVDDVVLLAPDSSVGAGTRVRPVLSVAADSVN